MVDDPSVSRLPDCHVLRSRRRVIGRIPRRRSPSTVTVRTRPCPPPSRFFRLTRFDRLLLSRQALGDPNQLQEFAPVPARILSQRILGQPPHVLVGCHAPIFGVAQQHPEGGHGG